jgi:hypothetical protein
MGGLPKEYAVRVSGIESTSEKNRDVILLRLQENEADRGRGNSNLRGKARQTDDKGVLSIGRMIKEMTAKPKNLVKPDIVYEKNARLSIELS